MNRKMIWNDGLDSWTEEELLCMKYLNVCYGKGGGSAPPPQPSSVSQTTTSEFPTELRPFISDIFEKTQAVQEQRQEEGFQPELTQQLAQFTPEQEASFQGIENVVGQSQPLFDEATTLARQSGRAATDPAEIAALMNPFLRNVTDIQKREAQRVGDVQEQQLAAQASQAGAFGGSRAAILEAERQRNLNQQLGDIEAQGLAASFQNAQNQLQNQFGRESASAAQLGSLGAAIPAQQFKEFGALSGIGAARQQQSQRALDIATQQAREEYGFPMSTLQDFSSILRGFPLPATQNVSRQSFSPAQPLSTQLLGLGTGLAGLAGAAGAFGQAGGAVSQMPIRMQNGGYIKLAGGGGLGQMMQEKLPSNRVRMGKTAYADGDQKSELETLLQSAIGKPASEKKAILEEALKRFPNQEALIRQGAAAIRAENLLPPPSAPVTGETATSAIEAASRDTPAIPMAAIPTPRGLRPENDLSLFQKVLGGLDKTVTGVDAGALLDGSVSSATTSLPTNQPPPTASLMSANSRAETVPSSPVASLADAPLTRDGELVRSSFDPRTGTPPLPSFMAEEIVGSGPQGMMAEEIVTGAPPLPQLANPNRLAPGDSPVVPPQELSLMSAPPTLPNILAPKDDSMGIYERRARENEMSMKGPVYPDPLFRQSKPLRSIGFDDVSGQQIDLSDPAVRQRMSERSLSQSFLNPTAVNPLDVEEQKVEDFQRSEALKARQLLSEQQSGGGDEFSGLKTQEELAARNASSMSIDPIQSGDLTDTATTINNAPIKLQSTEPTATAPGGEDTDPLTGQKKDPEKVAALQADYDQQIEGIKGRDYSDKVQKMLGDAPTYEKGEEPDFSGRMYLALANAGFALAGAPGTDGFGKAFGDAARVGIKDLTGIYKEKRKVQKELRQERNVQKRANYSDKLQRFNLAEKLRGSDLNLLKTGASIEAQKKSNQISAENAEANMMRAVSQTASADGTELRASIKEARGESGTILWSAVQARLDLAKKYANQAMSDYLKGGTGYSTERASEIYSLSYNKQKALLAQEIYGTVMIDGTLINNEEVNRRLGLGAAPAGNRKVNRQGLLKAPSDPNLVGTK